jgi:hypothetical protein
VLRGTVIDHEGRIADLETELQIQRRMRGVLDQPLVLGPPTGYGPSKKIAPGVAGFLDGP